ncbi:hypothetical protein GGR28_000509 [Lewinella aquimaris]|uniref:Uncharacterized protein n=1 Tax=Neolewinella aquimaris TaxID=1835722 RepID=A0A840E757_9BACT|nr:hypothetical protein [Neolewinella aquimaris]MBB4077908.1 hypothetical protein [Neolewinella aquimaris]
MWRLLLVVIGLILMIGGCNGLVSSQFGTYRLRVIPVEAARKGVGDADYVRITGTGVSEVAQGFLSSNGVKLRLFVAQPVTDAPLETHLIFWTESGATVSPVDTADLSGTVERPPSLPKLTAALNDAGVTLREPVTYVHLGERPLSWPWQLLMFLGGIGLAVTTEAVHHKKTHAETGVRS